REGRTARTAPTRQVTVPGRCRLPLGTSHFTAHDLQAEVHSDVAVDAANDALLSVGEDQQDCSGRGHASVHFRSVRKSSGPGNVASPTPLTHHLNEALIGEALELPQRYRP